MVTVHVYKVHVSIYMLACGVILPHSLCINESVQQNYIHVRGVAAVALCRASSTSAGR